MIHEEKVFHCESGDKIQAPILEETCPLAIRRVIVPLLSADLATPSVTVQISPSVLHRGNELRE